MSVEYIKSGIEAANNTINEGLGHAREADERLQRVEGVLSHIMQTLKGISFIEIENDLRALGGESRTAGNAFQSSADKLAGVIDGSHDDSLATAQQLTHEGWRLFANGAKAAADMEDDVHKRANRQLSAIVNTTSYLLEKLHTVQNGQTQAQTAGSEAVEISTNYSEGL
jgi:methyl-accepting chemotaxis protein